VILVIRGSRRSYIVGVTEQLVSLPTSHGTAEILQDNLAHTIFSWSKHKGLDPLSIERARGVHLFDRRGKRYIDFSSQLMNVNIGHGHPKVAEAVARQMAEVSYVHPGMITEARGRDHAGVVEPDILHHGWC
jgi:4-aminobutyrate aminotransferase-like enzyme